MSKPFCAAIVGAFSLLAFGVAAATASATVTLTSGTGNYVATTTANQTLSMPTAFGTLTISCSQTATMNITATTANAGDTVGSLDGVAFTCGSGASMTVLNRPIIRLNTASSSTLLVSIIDLQWSITTVLGSCLFRGNVGMSIDNNATTMRLLGGTMTYVSGICSGSLSVSPTGYSLSRMFSYTGTT
jgi:hypothetical protein